MYLFEEIKKWIGEITEVFLLLIAFGIVCAILFGDTVPLFGGITTNLMGLISTFGENGVVGLIALGIVVYLFQRNKATTSKHDIDYPKRKQLLGDRAEG